MNYDYTNEGRLGTYDKTTWRVKVLGERDGFIYIEFLNGPNAGNATKVPASWVTMDRAQMPCGHRVNTECGTGCWQ